MLHQSQVLETGTADNCRSQTKRVPVAREGKTVSQPSRGERLENTVSKPLPALKNAETDGVTRCFVIGKNKTPLMPAHPARARQLLRKGKAVVSRRFPFVIRLKTRTEGGIQPIDLCQDPGSRKTGLAIKSKNKVLWLGELTHRGLHIRDGLTQRHAFRRNRRARKTRYRKARFLNRKRSEVWLPPSLMHRVLTIETWVKRIQRWAPITSIQIEGVRFDTQLIQNPDIQGVEYQQGDLAGYEVRE